MTPFIARRALLAAAVAALSTGTQAAEPAFPSGPMRMVVGFAAGGGNDILARVIARELQQRLGPVSYTHLDVYKRQDDVVHQIVQAAGLECQRQQGDIAVAQNAGGHALAPERLQHGAVLGEGAQGSVLVHELRNLHMKFSANPRRIYGWH